MPFEATLSVLRMNCAIAQFTGAHGTITTSLGPEMWHGQVTQGYLVVWDDCKAAAFVVGAGIRKLAKG
jgi:hypothetical protein